MIRHAPQAFVSTRSLALPRRTLGRACPLRRATGIGESLRSFLREQSTQTALDERRLGDTGMGFHDLGEESLVEVHGHTNRMHEGILWIGIASVQPLAARSRVRRRGARLTES